MRIKNRPVVQLLVLALFYLLFTIFLFNTNPQNLPVGILIIPFVVLYILLFSTIKIVLGILSVIIGPRLYKKRNSIAFIVSFFATLLLVLKSINQLSLSDVLVIGALLSGLIFYASKLNIRDIR